MSLNNVANYKNPAFIFLAGFLVYNLLGFLNFGYFIDNDFNDFYALILFVIGAVGSVLGLVLANKLILKKQNFKFRVYYYNIKVAKYLIFIFFIFSVSISILMMIQSGGIPLLQGEESRNFLNPFLFNLYRCFPYVFVVYYFIVKQKGIKIENKYYILLVIYVLLSLLGGYRTQVVEIALFIFVYLFMFEWNYKQSFLYSFLSFLFIVLLGSIFSMVRIGVDYDPILFYQNLNLSFFEKNPILVPLIGVISMFRYSQYTVSSIIENLGGAYFNGQLFFSNFLTLLPGEQDAQRTIVGELIGARIVNGKVVSHTPTLQGAFYMDFGYLGVFIGFFTITFLITLFYKYFQKNKNPVFLCFFIYFVQYCILSIHVGYWDVVFLVFLSTMLICFIVFGFFKIKIETYY